MTKSESILGQLMMIGIEGTTLNKHEEKFIKEVRPSGVVYFRRNIENPKQVRELSRRIQKLLGKPGLIGIDQEGGRVARLGEPGFTEFPAMEKLGTAFKKTRSTELTRLLTWAMAQELKTIGVNLNFAPVADINTNVKNPIIGDRAFASDAATVAKLVAVMIKEYKRNRIVSCAKHFPGHGDTLTDSHKVLPYVSTSRATLMQREIIPFKSAIAAGVPTIMTAHVIYQNLDTKNSATLSPKILQSILRNKLKYKGVIISDDLEMNAIANHFSPSEAALNSIDAGIDMLLICKSLEKSQEIFEALVRARAQQELDMKKIKAALLRVSKLHKNYSRYWRIESGAVQKNRKLHKDLVSTIEKVATL